MPKNTCVVCRAPVPVGTYRCKRHQRVHTRAERNLARQVVAGQLCVVCGQRPAEHADHIRAWAHGGKTVASNLRPLCATCNRKRGTGA